MDNLTYTYTGNKLTKVSDAATAPVTYPDAFHFVDRANVDNEYTYDKNGNLKKDLNKNITLVTYNALNLPGVITYSNNNTVTYVYDGGSNKLSVAYYNKSDGITTKTEYAGNKVYKNGTLSMVLTEEGYATVSGTPVYYYYLKDHQGNNRVVINQGGGVQQVNHYYPFGGLFGEGIQTVNQSYKYNGKELDRINGLDMYDYGARHYDAALGRWFTPDPLAEANYHISLFVYTSNNPVNKIDPTGMLDDWVEDKDKRIYWDENATSQATTKEGETYIGKTVYATNEDGAFRYGDQYGNWHNSAPLGEVSVTGFATSGYDPEWIKGFHQFVDAGLAAINLTLSTTMLASNTTGMYNGLRARAALNTTGNAAKTAEKAIVIGEGMYRVKPAARSVGAKWYQAWSKNFPNGRLMTEAELNAAKARNARWLNSKINQGYKIYDIGPKGTNITSPFYQLERDIIQKTGYPTTPLLGY